MYPVLTKGRVGGIEIQANSENQEVQRIGRHLMKETGLKDLLGKLKKTEASLLTNQIEMRLLSSH
jgi:hypothetical protein